MVPGRRSVQSANTLESIQQLRVTTHQQTEQRVGVPGQELRSRVQHQIGADVEGPLQQGSGERAVHNVLTCPRRAPQMAGRSATSISGFVGDSSQTRSAPSAAASTSSVFATSTRRTSVPSREARSSAADDTRQIAVRRQHQHTAGRHQLESGVGRRHATAVRQRRPTLQGTDGLLEGGPGRVAVPAVAALASAGRVDADVGRREHHRWVQRSVGLGGGRPRGRRRWRGAASGAAEWRVGSAARRGRRRRGHRRSALNPYARLSGRRSRDG